MSIEDENKLGDEFVESVNKELEFLDDTFADRYLTELGNYLGEFQVSKPFNLTFKIAKDSQINAFAGPAGHIYLYTGLINIMDEADELASVISHEIGHVSARHLSRQAEQGTLVSIGTVAGMLAGALLGGDAGEALMLGSYAAGTQAMLSYSRDDEREADQRGFKKAYLAGFNPNAFVTALAKLQQGQWGTNQTPSYLLTHPVDSERMANLTAMSTIYTDIKESKEAEHFRAMYPLFRAIVMAQSTDPREAERYFSSELENEPGSGVAHFGLAMALQRKGEYDKATGHYITALDSLDEKASVLRYMGENYQLNGQEEEAIGTFEKALAIDSRDKPVLYLLAMSYQDAEEYAKAVQIYDRLTLIEPVKDEVFYNLGLCLGRQDILGLAHYNFGRYFKRTGDRETAEFHFKKAGELAGGDQALQEKIRKEREEMKKDNKQQPGQQPGGQS